MATWDGDRLDSDEEKDDDEFIHPPRSERYVIPVVPSPDQMHPDTELNVQNQTEGIVKNFLYQQYRQNQIRQSYDSAPSMQELLAVDQEQINSTALIGRQLARIGDEINDHYADEFDHMFRQLNLNKDNLYDTFANVAKKMIANGLNWGRVIALLCFGFRMAMSVLRNCAASVPDFLKNIIKTVVKVFALEKISKWIADQGGWIAALTFTPSASNLSLAFVALTAITSIAAVIYYRSIG